MSTLPQLKREQGSWLVLSAMVMVSWLGHIAGLVVLPARTLIPAANKAVELEIISTPPPPPPPKEEPKAEPKPAPKPPPVKVALVKPPPKEPPPSNDPPPEPTKPVPLVVGISLSSTTTAGGFAAPVGNTAYGKVSDKAVDPNEVKPYGNIVPAGVLDTEPALIGEFKIPFPEEARKAGVEGTVFLSITIDDQGNVVAVRIVRGMGYGLDEAAREAMKRFRFKPAIKGGQPVATTIPFRYTFELD